MGLGGGRRGGRDGDARRADHPAGPARADRGPLRGFVYAVGLLGITGERDALASSAKVIAARCAEVTDTPVLVGVGISTPEQAVEVCEVADGVVVGSAVVRCTLETGSPEAVAELVGSFRTALDRG